MEATYIDHMGSDLTVVNAARVSFNKKVETLEERDEKLIKYLATHNHWTPFGHPQITLLVSAPICIRTQCYKHKVGFVENEVSRRYVSDEPWFYVPTFRERATNAKQGSGDELPQPSQDYYRRFVADIYGVAEDAYRALLTAGVAPEQARMVLPQGTYTEWYWTGSLAAYARFCNLRMDAHAQVEIQQLAKMVYDIIQPLFPVSMEALCHA